jgi:DNA adenine methylase
MRNDLDYADIMYILRAEGYIAPTSVGRKIEPTGAAYSVVWLKGGWWVPSIHNLFKKYDFPHTVSKAIWELINSVLRFEYKIYGWLPPELAGTMAEDELCPQIDPDEKRQLFEEVQRSQMALISEIDQWSYATKTTVQENKERIDSYCRWVIKHDYLCPSNLTVLLKKDERKKQYRDERGLTAAQTKTGTGPNPIRDHFLANCEYVPENWATFVCLFGQIKLSDIPLDQLGYSNMRPMFKWVGGKRMFVPLIQAMLRSLEVYPDKIIEPFCGAAAMSLGLGFTNATINDRNPGLINHYRHIRSGGTLSTKYLATYKNYMQYRTIYNKMQRNIVLMLRARTPISPELQSEWSSLFKYLITFSFNGIWRVNKAGEINAPPRIPNTLHQAPLPIKYAETYPQFQKIAAKWDITNRDFKDVEIGGANTLLYVDPPYDDQFTSYTSHFGHERQEEVFQFMAKHDGPIICHNSQTPSIMSLAAKYNFSVFTLDGKSSVAADADSRGSVPEVILVKNFNLKR